jgi:hypothetical protein
MTPREIYDGSDADATRALYKALEAFGPQGLVALNLFRASKCSARAKVYRGGVRGRGSYKSMAYERKAWSMENLTKVLNDQGKRLGITWGWKQDPKTVFGEAPSWVLYIDLPGHGQVSFHSPTKLAGPTYPGDWDGTHESENRIIDYCGALLDRRPLLV